MILGQADEKQAEKQQGYSTAAVSNHEELTAGVQGIAPVG